MHKVPKTNLEILSVKLKSTLPDKSEKLSEEEARLVQKLERIREERQSLANTFSDISANVCIGYAALGYVLAQVSHSLDDSLSNIDKGRIASTSYRYYVAGAIVRFQLLEYFEENRPMLDYLVDPEFLAQLPDHVGKISGGVITFCQSIIVNSGCFVDGLSKKKPINPQSMSDILDGIVHQFETFRIVLTPEGEFAYFEATIPSRVGLPVVSALSLLSAEDDEDDEEDLEDDEPDEEEDDDD